MSENFLHILQFRRFHGMQNVCYATVLVWLKHINISYNSDEIKEIGRVAGMYSILKKLNNMSYS